MPREGHTQIREVAQLEERRRRVGVRTAHCPRCKRRVLLRKPWRGYRYLRLAWFGVLLGFLPLLPAMAFDACVLLPAFMIFLTAIGPLNALARKRPACVHCGLDLGPPVATAEGGAEVIALRTRRRRQHTSLP